MKKKCIILSIRLVLVTTCLLPALYCVWIFTRSFVMDYFSIPTNSMQLTICPGDNILVNKFLFGARIYSDFNFVPEGEELQSWRTKGIRRPLHNDIVVFNFPHHNWNISFVINNVYCKRIIGVPGDSIWTENGYYKNNNYEGSLGIENQQRRFSQIPDSILPKEVLNTFPFDDINLPYTTKNMHPVYVPRQGDVIAVNSYEAAYYKMILEWEMGKRITWDWKTGRAYADGKLICRHEFKHNYYFMAGDNVIDSYDSRYFGLVPEEYIVGIVGYIYHRRK